MAVWVAVPVLALPPAASGHPWEAASLPVAAVAVGRAPSATPTAALDGVANGGGLHTTPTTMVVLLATGGPGAGGRGAGAAVGAAAPVTLLDPRSDATPCSGSGGGGGGARFVLHAEVMRVLGTSRLRGRTLRGRRGATLARQGAC